MLEKLQADDVVLNQFPFLRDELQYQLIHFITAIEGATKLKTPDGRMLFAGSPGHNAWLWLSEDVTDEYRLQLMKELIAHHQGTDLPGICGSPSTAEQFANLYSEINALEHHAYMKKQTYSCPKVIKPVKVKGQLIRATPQHVELVAEFMAGFTEDVYGASVIPASQLPAAEGMVMRGDLYFWAVDELPVAMANIAHRSPRHGRINLVYTPPVLRKNGYASAVVAGLCSVLEDENREPMLYADAKKANKVYKNIGFVESGLIAEIRFM
ncbi:GNAT family N-acetyltransferase [Paenibacillus sinopodophylli]|uniref:GNAT family N-acetyltransferase n=1 Tax=Paenibacillus sinopodophylli TaxID=1837342 RepID=UPI00110C9233|nr:GNAT family N-acetyltransferase [Paenibacillus sinopodophylli]